MKDQLKLVLLTPAVPLTRKIHSPEIHRPGLAFSGFYDYFAFDCVQILGKTEIRFLNQLKGRSRETNLKRFFSYRIPCIVVAKQQSVSKDFLEQSIRSGIPVFRSPFRTARVASQVTVYVERAGAPETSLHATLVDVYGVGILLLGKSGVGKSECALELVERGHRLVADDMVEIRAEGRLLMGRANPVLGHHMEIRGLGIIDVRSIFGVGAVLNQKRITLAVSLEHWKKEREYERLGLEDRTYKLLGIGIPHLIIPVRPGRNIPILVETAALTRRLNLMGGRPAKEFNQKLIQTMHSSVQEQEVD
ncbi:MAG: HPr(Ser) kinase/phosphatase [Candidatus Omnitrophica bacterium]|nr:HPr(Ser) kinase/phosphatase [Candidatus Omnitrophota bacterium]